MILTGMQIEEGVISNEVESKADNTPEVCI